MDAPSGTRPFGEGTPAGDRDDHDDKVVQPAFLGDGMTEPNAKPVPFNLNPEAKEWYPKRTPEAWRCLFLTFSNGHPITEDEIFRFFTYKFGNCVEKVYVHWPRPRSGSVTPQFGKVVFKDCLPLLITECGKKECKFMINGKPLWCKCFDPAKSNSARWKRKN